MIIAAYCRVSTEKEEQLSSLANQKAFFMEYARRGNHQLFRLYADEGISGTSLKKREEFNRLMRDARNGFFQAVVVKDVSRLSRNTVDFLVSIRELKSMGINVIFLNANMDSMGDSEFILTLFSAMAQEESSNLSKRTKFGKRINAEKGRVPQRLFGYDRVDNFTLAINSEEASIVRQIFTLYNEQGLGCRTISITLNQNGDRTKLGNDWNARSVQRILTNPIYKGVLVNHKYEIADFLTGKQVFIPEADHFYHSRPQWAIVTPAVFEKAQTIMASRRTQYHSGEPFRQGRYSGKHLFSTLIKCAHCGRSFTRKTYTYVNTRVYWRCATNDQYTAEKCENNVILDESDLIQKLKLYFNSLIPDKSAFISGVLADLAQKIPGSPDLTVSRQSLETKRKKLLFKKERYQEMYANELITLSELKSKLSSITEVLREVDQALEAVLQSSAPNPTPQCDATAIHRFLNLETITNADLRQILEYISVNRNGTVKIVLKKITDVRTL